MKKILLMTGFILSTFLVIAQKKSYTMFASQYSVGWWNSVKEEYVYNDQIPTRIKIVSDEKNKLIHVNNKRFKMLASSESIEKDGIRMVTQEAIDWRNNKCRIRMALFSDNTTLFYILYPKASVLYYIGPRD